mgnify:CR=1 FL=1
MYAYEEICLGQQPDATIIWLHGLGADGHDFVPAIEQMAPEENWRFILPHAPHIAVTINHGMRMPAWYDIYGSDIAAHQDRTGIEASAAGISQLIAAEQSRGIPANRILLAGFSQGGAIALHCGLRQPEALAGIIALSTYLPLHDRLPQEKSRASDATPIFMAHGIYDAVIPAQVGQNSASYLEQQGYRVAWHSYHMQHSVCNEELADIRAFITRRLEE